MSRLIARTAPRAGRRDASARRPAVRARATAVAVLASLGLALTATPALAHDTLVESDPADGDTLEEAPTEAVLTYSAELTPSGGVAVLQGPDGEETELDEPTYDGRDAIWELPEIEDGEQTLVWSVISSDGHRIEGEIPFTVTTSGDDETQSDDAGTSGTDDDATTEDTAEGAATDDAGAAGSDDDATTDDTAEGAGDGTDASDEDGTSDDGADDAAASEDDTGSDDDSWLPGSRNAWLIGGIALVVAAGAAVWFVAVRNRGDGADGKGRGEDDGDATV
ncbi:copper resistance CopC family protein [Georgenia sp. Z1491]|uniref:copper resistance CopC family protein n=1 Tax=Georgenia sp. Z1491 TaxID=3416707 RepID=UPI003CE9AB94